jgi:hypothetical protein
MVNCVKMMNSASKWTQDNQNIINFTVFKNKSDILQFIYKRVLKFMSTSEYANATVLIL